MSSCVIIKRKGAFDYVRTARLSLATAELEFLQGVCHLARLVHQLGLNEWPATKRPKSSKSTWRSAKTCVRTLTIGMSLK